MAKFINTNVTDRVSIKLPYDLATHPHINDAEVSVNEDVVTFKLPPAKPHESMFADIWQYINSKQKWVCVTFTK